MEISASRCLGMRRDREREGGLDRSTQEGGGWLFAEGSGQKKDCGICSFGRSRGRWKWGSRAPDTGVLSFPASEKPEARVSSPGSAVATGSHVLCSPPSAFVFGFPLTCFPNSSVNPTLLNSLSL